MARPNQVGVRLAVDLAAYLAEQKFVSSGRAGKVFGCSRRTAGRALDFFVDQGIAQKEDHGYRYVSSAQSGHNPCSDPVLPKADTAPVENVHIVNPLVSSAQSGQNSSAHFGTPQLQLPIEMKQCSGITTGNQQPDESLPGMEDEHLTGGSQAIAGSFLDEDPEAAHCVGAAQSEDGRWNPDEVGDPDDKGHDQDFESFNGWSDARRPPSEITGARPARAYSQDENVAAYQEDVDKLVGVISREVEARILFNRRLGEQRKNRKITAGTLHSGKKEWRQLRDIAVGLAADRADGELRYAAMQNFGYRLDGLMAGWREKMAIDPAILRGYEEQYDQWVAEQRARRKEEERQMWRDLQKTSAAEADLGESAISELPSEPATASESVHEPISDPVPAVPVTAFEISAMPTDLSWPDQVVWLIAQGEQDLDAIAAAIDQPLRSVKNVIWNHGGIETRRGPDGCAYYCVPYAPVPQPAQELAAAPKEGAASSRATEAATAPATALAEGEFPDDSDSGLTRGRRG